MKKVFKYDIFISYKHEELDKAVAARLQKKLEQYKIPREIKLKTGKKKIERVFRDEEELSISSDLGKEIEGQLKESEYLLLVCSKKTKDSPWVLREIETFLKYQDINHILPVLIEGEPEEVFPEIILQYGEPLAVDLRETSTKKILKNADKELPRILAPVLHCSYDELKQRHKMYRMYRLLVIVGIGMGVAIIFAAYAIIQSQKLEKQYQATRKNQARYLCNISENLLESGDRIGALQTAMGVLPENENDNKPVVLEQMGALNNALYSYKHDNQLYFRANRKQELEEYKGKEIRFSKKGTYCIGTDVDYNAKVFDGKTGKLIWKIDSKNLMGKEEKIIDATPLDEQKVILVTKTKIVVVHIRKKKIVFQKKYKSKYSVNICAKREKIILWNENEIIITDLKNNKKAKKCDIGIKKNITRVILDSSGEHLFIAVDGELKRKVKIEIYSEKDKEDDGGIYKYSIKKEKLERISDIATEKIYLINNQYIMAIQYMDYKSKGSLDSETTYCLSIYCIDTKEQVWSQKGLKENDRGIVQAGCKFFNIKINENQNKLIAVFYFKQVVYCIDLSNYKLISKKTYNSQVVGVEQYDDHMLLIGLEEGSIYKYTGYQKTKDFSNWAIRETSAGGIKSDFRVECFYYNRQKKIALEYNRDKVVFLNIIQDNKVKILDKSKRIGEVLYFKVKENGKNNIYRCICYANSDMLSVHNSNQRKITEVVIYEVGKSNPIYTITIKKDKEINNVKIGLINGKITLCYIIEDRVKILDDPMFYMIDLETKKQIKSKKLSCGSYNPEAVIYANDLSYMWIAGDNDISGWDMCLTEDTLSLKEKRKWKIEKYNYMWPINVTNDNRYIIFQGYNYKNNTRKYYFKVWDIESNEWKKINGKQEIMNTAEGNSVAVGRKNNIMAVYKNSGRINIIDLDKGVVIKKINTNKKNICLLQNQIEFIGDDQYLLVNLEDGNLTMIDIQRGTILQQIETDLKVIRIIADEDSDFFAIKSDIIESLGKDKDNVDKKTLSIYMIDYENKTVIKYADIDYGWVSFEGKEVIGGKTGEYNITYYTKLYDFLYLKKEAEKLIKDEKLTQEQKRKYFM